MRVRVALVAGLALIAIALAVTLSRSSPVLAGTNSVLNETAPFSPGGKTFCQSGEALPGGTSAVRLWVSASIGPKVSVTVTSGSRVLSRGTRPAGWGASYTVTVPVTELAHAIADANVCISLGPSLEPLALHGDTVASRAPGGAHVYTGKVRIEYLAAGHRSWWSRAGSVVRHLGLGRAPSGAWVIALLAALMAAVVGLVSWSLFRGLTLAGWTCALMGVLSAASWSLVSPPFQVPDEPTHFAYVQYLAEAGHRPPATGATFSAEETVAMRDLHFEEVRLNPITPTISTPAQQQRLQTDLAQPYNRRPGRLATRSGPHTAIASETAATQPPLFYALQTIPYFLGRSGSLLDRLELMRLLSALMAGLTAWFAYLFVREVLPGASWAWSVGGLGVALSPLLGFIGGAVNPDVMLSTVSAACFYLLALGFRRGLTLRLAVALGTLIVVGFLTKLNFVGLAPGVVVGLILLARRTARASGRSAYRHLALALAIASSPVVAYATVNLLANHPALGFLSSSVHQNSQRGHLARELSYIWQLFLPRLPGMTSYFPGIDATRQIWFDRYVGIYGWVDTAFPTWLTTLALIPATLVLLLAARALATSRAALSHRLPELATYALLAIGVLGLIGADSYLVLAERAGEYAQPRYLLPLLPLVALTLALAARGIPRRWGPPGGVLLVLLLLSHDLFSQMQVIARYYG